MHSESALSCVGKEYKLSSTLAVMWSINLKLYIFSWHSHNFAPYYNSKDPYVQSFAIVHTPCVNSWGLDSVWLLWWLPQEHFCGRCCCLHQKSNSSLPYRHQHLVDISELYVNYTHTSCVCIFSPVLKSQVLYVNSIS